MTELSSGPLSGVRVVDLTSVVSGPVCAALLADQGADVVKVEPPDGDIMRRTSADGQFTAMFVACNRGKRSLALDLKRPEAQAVVRRLAAVSDVLVQNFRPGAIDRLGLSFEALHTINPRLIYASISGVGETGPYAAQRVYDPVIQSLSGLADVQTDETGRPRMVRTIIADKTTGAFAAQAICAALFARERTGEGQHIRLSMLDAMITFLWPEAMADYAIPGRPKPSGPPRPDLIYHTADGCLRHRGDVSNAGCRGLCTAPGTTEMDRQSALSLPIGEIGECRGAHRRHWRGSGDAPNRGMAAASHSQRRTQRTGLTAGAGAERSAGRP